MKPYITILAAALILASCSSNKDIATFVILPDTQTYLEQCPEVFDSQIDWIIDNKKSIDAVLQVGDLTQDNSPVEWHYMSRAFDKLEKVGIKNMVVWGNHDIGSRPGQFSDVHNTVNANRYFRHDEWRKRDYWGGSADGKTLDNYYTTFKAGGIDWLVLNMEFGPSDEAIVWADSVIAGNPGKKVVLNTHAYLYSDSTLHDGDDWWLPQSYGIGKEAGRHVNDGASLWKNLISKYPNIIAVFCGHVLHGGVGTLVSTGENGNSVYQMLANFQRGVKDSRLGGEGYLRIVKFNRKTKEINVSTFSTWNKTYHPSPEHNFVFKNVDL